MKLAKPLIVRNVVFKNRIMFPPLTTGYEEKEAQLGNNHLLSILG